MLLNCKNGSNSHNIIIREIMMNKKRTMAKMLVALLGLTSVMGTLAACKASNEFDDSANTLEIYAVDAGYGITWLEKCIENFEKENPDINVELWSEKGETGRAMNMISSGPTGTTTDLIFTSEKLYETQYKGYGMFGYDNIFEDLTDIYNAQVPGEEKPMKEKIRPELLDAFAVEEEEADGSWSDHYYFSAWAGPVSSMVYNDTLLKAAGLTLPTTTDEWIAMMKTYRDANTNDKGEVQKYSFACSTQVSYLQYVSNALWAQYDGYNKYTNYYEGKNEAGEYSHEIFQTKGKLYNLLVLNEVENIDNGYCDPRSIEYQYTEAQMQLVTGNALMIPCGDWFENEMADMIKKSGKNYTFKMMRIPVVSALSDRLSYWALDMDYEAALADSGKATTLAEYDKKLSSLIAYVDGNGEKPAWATDDDVKIVREARSLTMSLADTECAVIPAWATAKEAAKKFLQYLATDEANKIMMTTTNGGLFPYEYDWLNDSSLTLTEFQKSKIEIWNNCKLLKTKETQKGVWLIGMTDYTYSNRFFQRNNDYKTPREVFESGFVSEQAFKESLRHAGLL